MSYRGRGKKSGKEGEEKIMTFVWKNIGEEKQPFPAVRSGEVESGISSQAERGETRLLDGRPVPQVGRKESPGDFYNGSLGGSQTGTICSPGNISHSENEPEESNVWGWDPNKREERTVIERTSEEVQTAFLMDESAREPVAAVSRSSEEVRGCSAFNATVHTAEKASFNSSYDSGVFDSYDSGVYADDNSVVE